MTTTTTIPIDRYGNTGDPDGPIDCARCSLSLVDREPDWSNADRAEWTHDTGDNGAAICAECQETEDQAEGWLMLAKWRSRAPDRGFYLASGVTLYEGQTAVIQFAAPRAVLPVGAIRSFMSTDPLMTAGTLARFELLAGAVEECPATERNVGA